MRNYKKANFQTQSEGPATENSTKLSNFKQLKEYGQNRILVADDEEFCIASIKGIMMGAGIDVENKVDFCINGQEALTQITTSYPLGISYALIFTDFSMPVLDGIESTKRIRDFFN